MRSPPAIAVVAAAMLVSAPALLGLAQGSVAPASALARFLVDLIACWGAGTLLLSLVARWQHSASGDASPETRDDESSQPAK